MPTQIISPLNILKLITSTKSLLLYKVAYSRVLRIGTWTSLIVKRALFSLPQCSLSVSDYDKVLPANLPKVTQMGGTSAGSPNLPDPKAVFLSTKPMGFKLKEHHPEGMVAGPTPKVSDSVHLEQHLKICIFNTFLADAIVPGPRFTL